MVNVLKAGEVLKAGVSKLVKIEDGEKMQIYSPSGDQIGMQGRLWSRGLADLTYTCFFCILAEASSSFFG